MVLVPALVLAFALGAAAMLSGDAPPEAEVRSEPAPTSLAVDRPDIGFAVELPPSWTPKDDDPANGSAFYATTTAGAWMRVFKNQTDLPLDQWVDEEMRRLERLGGAGFVRQPAHVAGLPGIRLDFMLPLAPTPGASLAPRRWFLVKHGSTEFTLALGTRNLARDQDVLAGIAASFTLR